MDGDDNGDRNSQVSRDIVTCGSTLCRRLGLVASCRATHVVQLLGVVRPMVLGAAHEAVPAALPLRSISWKKLEQKKHKQTSRIAISIPVEPNNQMRYICLCLLCAEDNKIRLRMKANFVFFFFLSMEDTGTYL